MILVNPCVYILQSPEEDYFSVHIRIVGDWTRELHIQYSTITMIVLVINGLAITLP